MQQIPKLNYASGSVTVLTERQKGPTAVQVCSLVITVLKLLPNPSVTAAFKKSLAMKQVLSPRLHTTLWELSPWAVKEIFIYFIWLWTQAVMIDFQRNAAKFCSSPGNNRRLKKKSGRLFSNTGLATANPPPLVITSWSVIPNFFLPFL